MPVIGAVETADAVFGLKDLAPVDGMSPGHRSLPGVIRMHNLRDHLFRFVQMLPDRRGVPLDAGVDLEMHVDVVHGAVRLRGPGDLRHGIRHHAKALLAAAQRPFGSLALADVVDDADEAAVVPESVADEPPLHVDPYRLPVVRPEDAMLGAKERGFLLGPGECRQHLRPVLGVDAALPHVGVGRPRIPDRRGVAHDQVMPPRPYPAAGGHVDVAGTHLGRVQRQFQALLAFRERLGRGLALGNVVEGDQTRDDFSKGVAYRGGVDADEAARAVASADLQFQVGDRLTPEGARQRVLLGGERRAFQVVNLPLPVIGGACRLFRAAAENQPRLHVVVDQLPRAGLGDHHPDRHLPDHRLEARPLQGERLDHLFALLLDPFASADVAGDGLDGGFAVVIDQHGGGLHVDLAAVDAQKSVLAQRNLLAFQQLPDALRRRCALVGMDQLQHRPSPQLLETLGAVDAERRAVGVDEAALVMNHHRIRRHLDHGAVALFAFPKQSLHLHALAYVAADGGDADNGAVRPENRGKGERHPDLPPLFAEARRFQVLDALSTQHLRHDLPQLVEPLRGDHQGDRFADRFRRRVAVEPFSPLVPTGDDPLWGLADDGVVGGIGDGGQSGHGLPFGPEFFRAV